MTRNPFLVFLLVASGACAGDDVDPTGEPVGGAGVVHGVVDYQGSLEGPLVVGVFAAFPPRGAPLARQVIDAPAFPQPYAVRGVPPGRWFVLAMIDVDPSDGDRYRRARDPGGAYGSYSAPWSLTVDAASGAAGVDITLLDPSALP